MLYFIWNVLFIDKILVIKFLLWFFVWYIWDRGMLNLKKKVRKYIILFFNWNGYSFYMKRIISCLGESLKY